MEDVSTLVARQYDAFAYPPPADDLEQLVARGGVYTGDPHLYAPILWPEGRPTGPLRILIAGCGTIQAAYTAYMNKTDEVVGVDLSETSLGHERFLQERHGLENLKLYRGDLLEVGQLSGRFDVIICSGVLHHMADPAAGLSALRDVLEPEGVMVLMLYGQAARVGVYMLQDVFRRMGLKASADGIAKARSVLPELPQDHCAQPYIRLVKELEHDSAFADTFLHPQDRAYTVPQVLDLLDSVNLEFQNWVDSAAYWRNLSWGPTSAVGMLVDPLPPEDHWAVVELLRQDAAMHTFTARHKAAEARLKVDFANPGWREFTPHRSPDLLKVGIGRYQRRAYSFPFSPIEEFVIDNIDGDRTIGAILSLPEFSKTPPAELDSAGRAIFEHQWKLGNIMVALPSII
jgi:SAM-dependent methyltransferase